MYSHYDGYGIIISIMFALVYGISSYIINSLTIYTIAKEKRMNKPYFAWIPILNNYLFIKEGNGCVAAMFALIGAFIPYIGEVIILGYSIYLLIILHELSKEYKVESLLIIIVGAFIPFIILIQYFKLYKAAKNRLANNETCYDI